MLTGLRHQTTCPKLGSDIPPTAENEMTSTIQFLGGKPIELNRRQIVKGLAAGYIVAVGGCVQNQALGRQQLLLPRLLVLSSTHSRAEASIRAVPQSRTWHGLEL